jgi:hypothetical protein
MSWGEHRILSSFLPFKIASVQAAPPQVAQKKTWTEFAKSSTKAYEIPFRSLQVLPAIRKKTFLYVLPAVTEKFDTLKEI